MSRFDTDCDAIIAGSVIGLMQLNNKLKSGVDGFGMVEARPLVFVMKFYF